MIRAAASHFIERRTEPSARTVALATDVEQVDYKGSDGNQARDTCSLRALYPMLHQGMTDRFRVWREVDGR